MIDSFSVSETASIATVQNSPVSIIMKILAPLSALLIFSTNAPAQTGRPVENKFEVTVEHDPDRYVVLEKSRGMGEWKPVAVSAAVAPDHLTLRDPFARKANAFYRVRSIPYSSPDDLDGDGRNDYDEGQIGVLNAADPFPASSGDLFLESSERFNELSRRDNFPGAANVREVKFLITDIRTNPKLHFMNVNQHQFHHRFARDVLGFTAGLGAFNSQTYFSNAARRNLAGSLVFHENYIAPDGVRGIYTLEFWPTDPVPFEFIELAYEMVAINAPFIERLAYHAPSETQRQIQIESQAEFEASFVHSIETEELFSNVTFQPMNQEEAFGRLVLSTGSETLSARDIVIFRNLPNDLTYVSGIITEVPQTPLSHVNLKAQQNGTPNAFVANASTHPDIAPLIGQNVFYRVTPEGFELRPATQEEVETFFESIRPPQTTYPPRNFSEREIKPLSRISFSQANAFGSKAANVAELRRILPDVTPDGFAVPFYFYDEFMKHNNFYEVLDDMLADPDFLNIPATREQMLADFRELIKDGSMPQWMYDAFSELRLSFPTYVTPRLRSSANAEDSTNFNGAGLYDSYSHYWDEGHLGKSAKQVWASLWNYRAYEERDFYRIDHRTSAMGILVHPNEKYEQANGVAVARNIFDPNWEGYYFNVQVGDNLVTNPDVNTVPEEFLAASLLGNSSYEVQYIRYSNLVEAGETILTREQILDLVEKMRRINNHFRSLYRGNSQFAMEIEFKITLYGELSIKQARPYNG
jgi:hypothetical protein